MKRIRKERKNKMGKKGGLERKMGERQHVSNKPRHDRPTSRALLQEFYECILNGNSFVIVRVIAKKKRETEKNS